MFCGCDFTSCSLKTTIASFQINPYYSEKFHTVWLTRTSDDLALKINKFNKKFYSLSMIYVLIYFLFNNKNYEFVTHPSIDMGISEYSEYLVQSVACFNQLLSKTVTVC